MAMRLPSSRAPELRFRAAIARTLTANLDLTRDGALTMEQSGASEPIWLGGAQSSGIELFATEMASSA